MSLRIISDVHGKIDKYLQRIEGADASVQLGDMSCLNYNHMDKLDYGRHRFFKGNHDNYDLCCEYDLGDYGTTTLGGVKFFFCRGAFSIDWKQRQYHEQITGDKVWWKQEQLSQQELEEMVEAYTKAKPAIMISHTCPDSIAKKFDGTTLKHFNYNPDTFTTPTQQALQACIEIHQPSLYVFGHFHSDRIIQERNTTYICVGELSTIDIDNNGNILRRRT